MAKRSMMGNLISKEFDDDDTNNMVMVIQMFERFARILLTNQESQRFLIDTRVTIDVTVITGSKDTEKGDKGNQITDHSPKNRGIHTHKLRNVPWLKLLQLLIL